MLVTAALALGGVFWATAYVLCIRTSIALRVALFPLVPVCFNVTWEAVYAAHDLGAGYASEGLVNLLWLCLDMGLLVCCVKFGDPTVPQLSTTSARLWAALAGLGLAALWQLACISQFETRPDGYSAIISAYVQNILMSVLFVVILASRHPVVLTLRGQYPRRVVAFGVCKAMGTVLPTSVFALVYQIPFVAYLGAMCLALDVLFCSIAADRRNLAGGRTYLGGKAVS